MREYKQYFCLIVSIYFVENIAKFDLIRPLWAHNWYYNYIRNRFKGSPYKDFKISNRIIKSIACFRKLDKRKV